MSVLIALADADQRDRVIAAAGWARMPYAALTERSQALADWEQHEHCVVVTGCLPDALGGQRLVGAIRARSGSYSTPAIVFLGGSEDAWASAQAAGADLCFPADAGATMLGVALAAAARRVRAARHGGHTMGRAEAMAEIVADGVVTIDAQGIVRWANPAALRMFGYERDELLGRDADVLTVEPLCSAHGSCLRCYHQGGVDPILGSCREVRARRKDGGIFPVELSVSEFHDGSSSLFVGILRDISLRKAAEAELSAKADHLERLRALQMTENELAREIVERQLRSHERRDPLMRHYVAPAELFSGDVVAAVRSSIGRLYVILADATGHGLAAAISLLPAISVFHGMAVRNLPLAQIVDEMNAKLRKSMPVGRFIAAALACIDEAQSSGEVWVGGVPDVVWIDGEGRVVQRFASNKLALGIVDSSPLYSQPERFDWHVAGQLFACSDGVLEARNERGEPFGIGRLLGVLAASAPHGRIDAVRAALDSHVHRGMQTDDISLLSIDLPA